MGFKETKNEKYWHLKWTDKAVEVNTLRFMKPFQRINHFPGMYHIARKDNLAFHLKEMKNNFKGEYGFFPTTFVLPCHVTQLEKYMKTHRKWMIAKPQASAQGKGVKLLNTVSDVKDLNEHIVQKYINNPLLLDGFKFDLRIYVLLMSINPLKICIYKDGLVRLATKEYTAPSKENKSLLYQHLTNYAINKKNPNYMIASNKDNLDKNPESFKGFKRSLKDFFEEISENESNEKKNKLLESINDIIRKLICSIHPILLFQYNSSTKYQEYPSLCFEVLGIDVMIDKKYKPWLLEVNHSPNFHTDSDLDKKIKRNLISDSLKSLKIIENCKKIENQFEKQIDAQEIISNILPSKEEGDFQEIFDNLSTDRKQFYQVFIDKAKEIWDEKSGNKKAEIRKRHSLIKLERSLSKNQFYYSNEMINKQPRSLSNVQMRQTKFSEKIKKYLSHQFSHSKATIFSFNTFESQFAKELRSFTDSKIKILKPDQSGKIICGIRDNVEKFENPKTFYSLLENWHLYNNYILVSQVDQILKRLTFVLQNNYSVKSDKGFLFSSIIYMSCYKKLPAINEKFYIEMIDKLDEKQDEFSDQMMHRALQSLILNKFPSLIKEDEKSALILINLLGKGTSSTIGLKKKFLDLTIYAAKSLKSNSNNLSLAFEKVCSKYYQTIFENLIQLQSNIIVMKPEHHFNYADILSLLKILEILVPNDEYIFMNKKIQKKFSEITLKVVEVTKSLDIEQSVSFAKRYSVIPPSYIEPIFKRALLNSLQLSVLNTENLIEILTFISKIDLDFASKLFEQNKKAIIASLEKNTNSKEMIGVLEILSNLKNKDVHILSLIEKNILSNKLKVETDGELIICCLQNFTKLKAGSTPFWNQILSLITNRKFLFNLTPIELLIKVLPSVGAFTKQRSKIFTNISFLSVDFSNQMTNSKDELNFLNKLSKLWDILEEVIQEKLLTIHYSKYSIIIYNFTFANMIGIYPKIFEILAPIIRENLHIYNSKEISEIIYSYSRVNILDKTLFTNTMKYFVDKGFDNENIVEGSLLYWSLANSRIFDPNFIDYVEDFIVEKLQMFSHESFCQILYSASILRRSNEVGELFGIEALRRLDANKKDEKETCFSYLVNAFSILNLGYYNVNLWAAFIDVILQNKNEIKNNPVFTFYLYKIFIELHFIKGHPELNKLSDSLKDILKSESNSIIKLLIEMRTKSKPEFSHETMKEKIQINLSLKSEDNTFKTKLISKINLKELYFFTNTEELKDFSISQEDFLETKFIIPYLVDYIANDNLIEVLSNSKLLNFNGNQIKDGFSEHKILLFKNFDVSFSTVNYDIVYSSKNIKFFGLKSKKSIIQDSNSEEKDEIN